MELTIKDVVIHAAMSLKMLRKQDVFHYYDLSRELLILCGREGNRDARERLSEACAYLASDGMLDQVENPPLAKYRLTEKGEEHAVDNRLLGRCIPLEWLRRWPYMALGFPDPRIAAKAERKARKST